MNAALEETYGATGTLLRAAKGEVVLVFRLRAAQERLNPALPPEALTASATACVVGADCFARPSKVILNHAI